MTDKPDKTPRQLFREQHGDEELARIDGMMIARLVTTMVRDKLRGIGLAEEFGVTVFVFESKVGGQFAYASSAERLSMIHALGELIEKLKEEIPPPAPAGMEN